MHIAFIILTFVCGNAFATIYGVPAPHFPEGGGTCTWANGEGTGGATSGSDYTCWLAVGETPALFGSELGYKDGDWVGLNEEFQNAFFPTGGTLRIREYICESSSPTWCTIAKSKMHIDGKIAVKGDPSVSIQSVEPDFGGNATTIPKLGYNFTICLAFIDDDGAAWGNNDPIACQDAKQLPDTPALCLLNGSATLDVNMGTVELSDISTTPHSGDSTNVKKDITIDCSGDSEINVETQFVFTPVSLNGTPAISTTIDNLGVALIYNGKIVSPNDRFSEKFSTGSTNIPLEFATVRNAEKNSVAPGNFTASAVMEMTVQ